MNGYVWCNNCESGGDSIFSFFLPLVGGIRRLGDLGDLGVHDSSNLESLEGQNTELELMPEDAENFRVLVLDDSLINLKVLQRMLSRLGVIEIKAFVSGSKLVD
jgi:hypothetical protein